MMTAQAESTVGVVRTAEAVRQKTCGRPRVACSVEQFAELYQQHKTLREIAEMFGVSIALVARRLDEAGIPRRSIADATRLAIPTRRKRRGAKRIDVVDHDHIVRLYEQSRSVERVVEEAKENKTLVSTVLKQRGFVLRRGGRTTVADDVVVSLCKVRRAGASWRTAARAHGIKVDAARHAVLKRGHLLTGGGNA